MKEKILLVDDERFVLDCFNRMLSTRFEIETACGPEEALGAIETHGPFAVVLSDFRMPGLNGVELLQKIKAMNPSTIGILLSGNADSSNPALSQNPALYRILDKPCPYTTLVAVLNDALAHDFAMQQLKPFGRLIQRFGALQVLEPSLY